MTDLERTNFDRILPSTTGSPDWADVMSRSRAQLGRRRRRVVVALAAAALVALGTASAFGSVREFVRDVGFIGLPPQGAKDAAGPTELNGTVGPGYTILLKKGAVTVKTLKPGRYRLTVQDNSNVVNFNLRYSAPLWRPGWTMGITEGVPFIGTRTVTLTLKRGRYTYFCAAHPMRMKKTFTVK
jgi:hypothetical protein